MDTRNSITDTGQDNTLETARQKLTPEEREALEANYKRQQSEKVSRQRKATVARLRAQGRPYSGKPKLGLRRVVDKHGHKRDVSDHKQRALMQHIVRLRDDECMTFHDISDEVARAAPILRRRPGQPDPHHGRQAVPVAGHAAHAADATPDEG